MRPQHWTRPLTLALAAAVLTGCESSTEPDDPQTFDAELALADYEALEGVLASNSMAGFRAMAAGVTFFGGSEAELAMAMAASLEGPADPQSARAFAGKMAGLASRAGLEVARNPIISVFRRGKTFVYDPDLGRYVMDQELEGAPETGVRFILYSPAGNGKPDPSDPVGHADLIDLGDTSEEKISLRLVVVEGLVPPGDTILDYSATLDVMEQGGKISVNGFLRGDEHQLDFNIVVEGSDQPGQAATDVNFTMGISSLDFSIVGSVTGVENDSGELGTVELTVRHGTDASFQVDVQGTESTIQGTFMLNGNLFATVSGHPDSPTFTGASGGPLTLVEALVLRQMVDSAEDVFDLFEDLLDPMDELILLALIL
jgi:hypothetical protein